MLTSDLVQARLYKKKIHPRYVDAKDPDYVDMAAQLIQTFEEFVGRSRGELDAELKEVLGYDTDFQLHKALAKLLLDRCEFEEKTRVDPEILRREVFDAAAAAWAGEPHSDTAPAEVEASEDDVPDDASAEEAGGEFLRGGFDRERVLGTAVERLKALDEVESPDDLDAEGVDSGLYADLKDEQVLARWKRCGADWLLRRYNVALAQGVLLRASEMEIELASASVAEHRALFRKIKFFQLMHRIRRLDDGGWRIVLDGPASLFQSSTKYGLQMASFLPTLLHFGRWKLTAQIAWGPKRRKMTFELDPSKGLRSHTKLTGQWQPEELRWLPEQLPELDDDWRVSTDGDLVDLGGEGVLVPDYVFTHGPSGTKVVMEVFGFWNRGAIETRLKLLRRHGPKNLVLAVSSQLATGREDLGSLAEETGTEIYVFRTHPIARKVLTRLNARI